MLDTSSKDRSTQVLQLFKEVACIFHNKKAKTFEAFGITPPQGMVVGILGRKKEMKLSDLSNELGLSNSTVSGIIDRLEKQESVERIRSKEDKRVVYVRLTDGFKKMNKGFHEKLDQLAQSTMSECSEEDFEKIIDGLETLKKILSK
ncbi:MarR family transcriptional regulator [Anaerobacterium chartisolvens]|uniref:MarR family transcriptional regulator n=1 Tax=Anaerobacterium chartisolvens TaxID=1297424 RepID=A0A369BHD9_9FIRM|nr:MarR family transcriptional regulator [Anaerobacterium chartisolvens]RCX20970.1 MarR family transcriptional regulator [Anaerobacterium chartisolvens]